MFVQITELSPEGERDWLVQAEDPSQAYSLLMDLVAGKRMEENASTEYKLIGQFSEGAMEGILETKSPEQFAFICINS